MQFSGAKIQPFVQISKLWGIFLWMFATEIMDINGFCRENQGVSRVVEEKSGVIFGIGGFSPYLCNIKNKNRDSYDKDISFFILVLVF